MKRLIIILLSVLPLVAWAQEEAAQSWEDNDSVVMAPLQVKAVGTNTYEDLNRVPSSLDLQDPDTFFILLEPSRQTVNGVRSESWQQLCKSSSPDCYSIHLMCN